MNLIKRIFDNFIEITAVTALVSLVILTIIGILSRYIFSVPISLTEEVARILFIWVSFLGAAIVMKKNEHIRLDILEGKFPPMVYSIIQIVVLSLVTFFCLIMFIESIMLLDVAFKQTLAVTRISMGIVYLILPASALFMGIYSFLNLIHIAMRLRGIK
jgi:TRAP-type transport system small permease protein